MATNTTTTTTTTTHPAGITAKQQLLFVSHTKGGLRYHRATCSRVDYESVLEPTADVLAHATKAMCCKPNPNLLAPYAEAARQQQQASTKGTVVAKVSRSGKVTLDTTALDQLAAEVHAAMQVASGKATVVAPGARSPKVDPKLAAQVVSLRDDQGMGWRAIARELGLGEHGSPVARLYRTAKAAA